MSDGVAVSASAERARKWRLENPERSRKASKDYYDRNRDAIRLRASQRYHATPVVERRRRNREMQLRRYYSLTPAEFQAMRDLQEGRCRSCGDLPGKKGLCVDHHHESGRVRGLVCNNCNLGLGHFKDSPERLRLAAAYLEEGGSIA